MTISKIVENGRRKAVHNSVRIKQSEFYASKIDMNTADKHTAEYRYIFIWTMVLKQQTKRKMMLNDVFVLFQTHKSLNHALERI